MNTDDDDYPLVLRRSAEGDGDSYQIEFMDLPGCSAGGASLMDAIVAAGIAKEEWLATAREAGRAIPPLLPNSRTAEIDWHATGAATPTDDNDDRFVVQPLTKAQGGGYLVRHPGMPGCIAEGGTLDKAIEAARTARRAWRTYRGISSLGRIFRAARDDILAAELADYTLLCDDIRRPILRGFAAAYKCLTMLGEPDDEDDEAARIVLEPLRDALRDLDRGERNGLLVLVSRPDTAADNSDAADNNNGRASG